MSFPIHITASSNSPEITFDEEHKVFTIKGISMPENAIQFYEIVFNWFDDYEKNPIEGVKFHIQLDYFNTTSSKSILEIFKRIKKTSNGNFIVWHYESDDDEIKEAGEEYREILGDDLIQLSEIPVDSD